MSRVISMSVAAVVGCGGNERPPQFVWLDDASVVCDPGASIADDLFVFTALTSGKVARVTTIVQTPTVSHTVTLESSEDGYWSQQLWADEIGSDCDEFGSLGFVVEAFGTRDGYDKARLTQSR